VTLSSIEYAPISSLLSYFNVEESTFQEPSTNDCFKEIELNCPTDGFFRPIILPNYSKKGEFLIYGG